MSSVILHVNGCIGLVLHCFGCLTFPGNTLETPRTLPGVYFGASWPHNANNTKLKHKFTLA